MSLRLTSVFLIFAISLCFVSCKREGAVSKKGPISKPEMATKRVERKESHSELSDFGSIRARLLKQPSEGFDEIWNSINQLPDSDDVKGILRELLLGQMCKSGHTGDALDKVLQTFGPGSRRALMIKSIFAMSTLSVGELFELQNKLSSDSDKGLASIGIANSLGNTPNLATLDPMLFERRGKLGREVLETGLASYVKIAKYKGLDVENAFKSALDFALNMDSRGRLDIKLAAKLTEDVSHDAPFEVWNAIHSQKIQMDASVIAKVAEQMTQNNIVKAISTVTSDGGGAGVKYAFNYWLQFDTNEANKWYLNNGAALSNATRDQILEAFVDDSTRTGNLERAKTLLDRISDLDQRKITEGRIWSAERDALKKEVASNAAGTVQGIISGQSKYADYWLEEAMGTWVAKDFDKAQEWYQQNWKSLPSSKSQYVAAAFANQALTQGDAATASQWAALIQDPKTKQRIQDGINKAIAKNQGH